MEKFIKVSQIQPGDLIKLGVGPEIILVAFTEDRPRRRQVRIDWSVGKTIEYRLLRASNFVQLLKRGETEF